MTMSFCVLLTLLVPLSSSAERLTSVLIFPIRVSGVTLKNSQNIEIRNYLGTRLTIEGVYRVMPESQIRGELTAAKLKSYDDCYDEKCRIDLTKTVMADKSLSVEIVREDTNCRVTGNLYDIAQEVTETAADVACGCSPTEMKQAMVQVARQLSGKDVSPDYVPAPVVVQVPEQETLPPVKSAKAKRIPADSASSPPQEDISVAAPKVVSTGWLTQGGETLPVGTRAFEFSVGIQSIVFAFHVPVSKRVEVNPFVTLYYLSHASWVPCLGNYAGIQLKFNLWRSGPNALSLSTDLGVALSYPINSTNVFGVYVPVNFPEFKYSYRWNDPRVAVIAGVKLPLTFWVYDGFGVGIPILFFGGFEANVSKNINVHGRLELGPDVNIISGKADVNFAVGLQLGLSYLW
jgi:hypothetical protein